MWKLSDSTKIWGTICETKAKIIYRHFFFDFEQNIGISLIIVGDKLDQKNEYFGNQKVNCPAVGNTGIDSQVKVIGQVFLILSISL